MNYSTHRKIISIVILVIAFSCMESFTKKSSKIDLHYPHLSASAVSDDYFGKSIEDKYRLLENPEDKAVQQWIKEEKSLCDSVLSSIPFRDSLKSKLEEAIYSSNIRGGFPRTAGDKLFYLRFFTKEKVYKIFYKENIQAQEVELFSTDSLNKTGTTYGIDYFEPSNDGKYLAFGLSANGDEKSLLKVINVENKNLLAEAIPRTYYGNPQWIKGKDAFFYTQLKDIKSESDAKTVYEEAKVKLHLIGTDSKNDKEVLSNVLNKDLALDKIDIPFVSVSPNSDKVLAFTYHGTSSYISSLYFTSLNGLLSGSENAPSWKLIFSSEERATNVALFNHDVYVLNFKNNPNGSLKKYSLDKNLKDGITLVEGKEEVFEELIENQNSIYLKKLKNGISVITEIDMRTNKKTDLLLPFAGYVYIRPTNPIAPFYLNSPNFFFTLESWNREPKGYYYNPVSKEFNETRTRPQNNYGNPNDIVVKEIEIPSHDGALVPLSIVYSKNTELNGKNPTLLNAYGAYAVSVNSGYDPSVLAWVHLGGVYAVAHVRGGGEKGDSWYKGGFKATKSNSWKDFISCAEYLIKNKYTSPDKLAAKGGSAGGITVGMSLVERPDLFKAAILKVGMLNMLRFENTSNSVNVAEFGTTKKADEFQYLYDMDVYHHIKKDVSYPSILLTAELKDSRVALWQPAKAVAQFQEVSEGKNNVILFKVGEGGHRGNTDLIKEQTDIYSFLLWQLNHPKFIK
jgi:prolyl oligopeptidase